MGIRSIMAAALRTAPTDRASVVASQFQDAPVSNAGTPLPNDPATQAQFPERRPMRYPLTFPVQNLANGRVIAQAGAGRAITPDSRTFAPVQAPAPSPDGRIIARPMPKAGTDARQVIR